MFKLALRQLLKHFGYEIANVKLIPAALGNQENLLTVTLDLIIAQHLPQTSDFFFVQVGAFDGVECDPIRKYIIKHGWHGVLLEPQKKAFARLKANYLNQPQLVFKNVAIANQRTTRKLYTVGAGDVPEWARGLASFDRNVIVKHESLIPGLHDLIETEEVECITFDDVIAECGLRKIDLLQVDVEGYDAEIIKMFPFERIRPSIVHFERKHLSCDELESALQVLVRNKYKFANAGAEDMVAYYAGERIGL